MKLALPVWNGRIAPVFDTTGHVRVVEIAAGKIVREIDEALPSEPARKVQHLADLEVQVLICGAISRTVRAMVTAYAMRVVPFVSG